MNLTRILRFPEVRERVGLCRNTVDTLERLGRFPKRIRLTGERAVGWLERDITEYIEKLARQR